MASIDLATHALEQLAAQRSPRTLAIEDVGTWRRGNGTNGSDPDGWRLDELR